MGEATYSLTATTPLLVTVETEPDTEACNGSVNAIVLGGTPPYSYDWTNVPGAADEAMVTGLCFGEYFVQVTDARACTSEVVMGNIANERFACFEERVVITPDGNGSNDEFILFCADTEFNNNHLEIYNRWGQLVYEVDNYDNTWEGTAQNGEDLPEGPYYWVLDYVEPNGQAQQLRGSLTIVRE
jgi:gliding motility-associated-like protein